MSAVREYGTDQTGRSTGKLMYEVRKYVVNQKRGTEMTLGTFRYEFKRRYGVRFKNYILFRNYELFNLETSESIRFKNLEEALDYEISGKQIRIYVEEMTLQDLNITLNGGRGADFGNSVFKFSDAKGSKKGNDKSDFNSRANTQIKEKNFDAALKFFRQLHIDPEREHAFSVDENGYVHNYVHGNRTSVSIPGRKGEMIFHNHPSNGNFSKADMLSTSLSGAKGIVACGKNGDYVFVKTNKFKANEFVKAINTAKLVGKNYDDAVGNWLTANQKKYGYNYEFRESK